MRKRLIAPDIIDESSVADENAVADRGNAIPLWEKYSLTFPEAASYFGVGEKRLRLLVAANPRADYILTIGTHTKIKRQKFMEFLDLADAI